jgi:hypothetical protein
MSQMISQRSSSTPSTSGIGATSPHGGAAEPPDHLRLWRIAGWLVIAHVVLVFGGVAFERTPMLADKTSAVSAALVTGPMARTFGGGYVECLGFLVFLVGALLIARLLRGHGETAGWASSCIGGTASAYVAITIASGFAAGAAAMYNGHHGAPLATVTAVNDIRNFAFFLSGTVVGVFALSIAAAVRITGLLPRWVAYTGFVSGVLSIVSVPGARIGLMNPATLLWYAWFVAFGVAALRRPRKSATVLASPAVDASA